MSSHHYLSATLTSRSDWNNVLPLPSIQLQVLDESCSSRDARLGLLSHHTISFRCYFSVATRVGTRGPPEGREGGLGASRSVDGADERRGERSIVEFFTHFVWVFFFYGSIVELFCVSRRKKKTKTKKIEKIKKIKKKERKFLGHLNRFDRDRPTRPGSGGSVIFHKGKLIYVRVSVLNRLCAFIPRSFRPRNGTDGDVSRSSTFPPESTWAGVIKWQVVAILETSCDENDVITPPLPSIAICLRADGDDLKFFVAFIWFDFMCLVLN